MTEWSVKEFIFLWYDALNRHVPEEQIINFLDHNHLKMTFPEVQINGLDDFKKWYHNVCQEYFDEAHYLQALTIDIDEAQEIANIKLIVNWKAKTRDASEAYSQQIDLCAFQTWIISQDHVSESLRITSYVVDKIIAQ